jgi:hypothetical protein
MPRWKRTIKVGMVANGTVRGCARTGTEDALLILIAAEISAGGRRGIGELRIGPRKRNRLHHQR